MAVLEPLKLIIDNYPSDKEEYLTAVNNPENPTDGVRSIPFSRELWIERSDFMENAPKDFFRLTPGREVRLKYAYIIKCENVEKDDKGNVVAVHCSYDTETRSGMPQSNRKVKSTIHWLSAKHAKTAEVRLFDRLFNVPEPDDFSEGKTFINNLNPSSLQIVTAFIEPEFINTNPLSNYQFERIGYFCIDKDSTSDKLVFNRTVALKDMWTKKQILA